MAKLGIEIGASLNATGFSTGLLNIQRALDKTARQTSAISSGLSKLGGLISVGTLTAAAKKVIDYGSKIADLSKETGVSVEALQEFDYWAKQNGGSIDDVAASLRGLGRARDEALSDNKEKLNVFAAIGLDKEAVRRMNPEQLFRYAAEKIRTTDFGADEGIITEKLFGKGGHALGSALKESISDAADEARKLGIVIEESVVKALDDAGDAMDRFTAQARGPWAKFVAAVADSFATVIKDAKDFIELNKAIYDLHHGKATKKEFEERTRGLFPPIMPFEPKDVAAGLIAGAAGGPGGKPKGALAREVKEEKEKIERERTQPTFRGSVSRLQSGGALVVTPALNPIVQHTGNTVIELKKANIAAQQNLIALNRMIDAIQQGTFGQ